MGKAKTSLVFLPLLALLAALPLALNSRTPAAAPQAQRAAGQEQKSRDLHQPSAGAPSGKAVRLLEEYLDAQPGTTKWQGSDPRGQYTIDFIIATVPDPVESRLPHFFDFFLGSIQRASESAGYVLDRFSIDWPPQTGDSRPDSGGAVAPFEQDPGVLLFRDTGNHRLLLVFLIGETPTSGIHKAAMASALRQIASLFPWGRDHDKLPKALPRPVESDSASVIKVLGPSFSGSSASLEFSLRTWLSALNMLPNKPRVLIRIVSGTATAINPQDFARIGEEHQVSFNAVVPPDDAAMGALAGYLGSFGQQKIAILTEGNTSYGQLLKGDAARLLPEVLTIPFPLHISQLRMTLEKERGSQQAGTAGSSGASSLAPLPQDNNLSSNETPPVYSSLEVSSADLVLSNLLSALSREEIHEVGILATDVRDTVFLSQQIRAHCPSTVIFTLSSDLLYTRADVTSSTQGMLFVTPYPLFNLNQLWSPPFAGRQTRLQFPNQAAEGVYNATEALLDHPSAMLEYGSPFSFDTAERRAALWVMAVGRDGLLPVKVLPWSDPAGYSLVVTRPASPPAPARQASPTARGVYTSGSVFAVVALSLILVTFSLLLVRQTSARRMLKPLDPSNWFVRAMGDPVFVQYRPQSRLYILTCCSSLLSFYLLVVAAYSLPDLAARKLGIKLELPGSEWLVGFVIVAGLVTQFSAVALLARAFWTAPGPGSKLPAEVKALILCGSVAGVVLASCLVVSWLRTTWRSPSEAFFIYLRAFTVGSGLSCLVPLLSVALAAFLWGFCSFRRLRMIDGIQPMESTGHTFRFHSLLDLDTPSFAGTTDLEREVRDLLEGSAVASTGWYVALLALALLAGLHFFLYRFVRSFESGFFFILYGSTFFLVYWALAMEFVRLWLLWRRFARLLRRLAWHPMRTAYARYRDRFQGFLRVDFAMPPPTFTVLEFSIDQARRLVSSARAVIELGHLGAERAAKLGQWISGTEPEVEIAARTFGAALKADAQGDWRLCLKKRSESQCALARMTHDLVSLLEPYWSSMEHSPAAEDPKLDDIFQLGEEFLVGRAVLFISYALPSLRNLGAFVLGGLLLMLFSVVSYPFQPRDQFLLFNWVVILSFVGAALVILLQMERDVVLSTLNGTVPGQVTVTRQFVFRIFTYVLLPVVALLSVQFPGTVGQIFSLIGVAPPQP